MSQLCSRTWNFSVTLMQHKNAPVSKGLAQSSKKPCEKKVCRIGPRPLSCRDPPPGYNPCRLSTKTFKLPPFIKPKTFRPMTKNEILGPGASKCKCYKNPEFYSYHCYSYYDLMVAKNALKTCIKCCK